MLNMLIIDDNIFYAKTLMNYISDNENVRVSSIAVDGKEALDILNNRDDIDIFLLDLKLPKYNGLDVLRMITPEKKQKYKHSCIVISGESELIQKLTKEEMLYDFVDKNKSISDIIDKIIELISYKQDANKEFTIIKNITSQLAYLGYNMGHIGTQYLIETIHYISNKGEGSCENLKRDIYPYISLKYKTNVHNVKNSITRATNNMYYNCESKRLTEYFNFYEECKPNIKTVINTVLTKI